MPAELHAGPEAAFSTAPSSGLGARVAPGTAPDEGGPASGRGLDRSAAAFADGIAAMPGWPAGEVTLDRYQLRAVLGAGAMGTVYRAYDPRLDREVALKVLDGVHGRQGTDAVAEARNIARIDHPNVVTVYDAGAARDRLWVAMQLVEGGTLAARAGDPSVDLPDLLSLLIAAGEGLAAAHARGVVHRDVKPDNILIDGRGVAKLADFGLASRESATKQGRAGTPGFMAPEVQAGGEASPRSDQYSWCATAAWLARVQGVAFEPAVRAVVERGLAIEPAARWPSMKPLLEALAAARPGGGDPQMRASLIARVERAWIDGVLAPSMDTIQPVPLPLEWCPDLVAGGRVGAETVPGELVEWPPVLDPEGRALERLFVASGRSLLVVGEPGAGKTTAVLAWVRRRLDLARRHAEVRVPVVFGLASFRGEGAGALAAWCIDQLVERYGLPRAAAQLWLDGGTTVLVFDGLDEVPGAHRAGAARAVAELRATREQPMLVVCRRGELEALPQRPALGGAVLLAPLDDASLRRLGFHDTELGQLEGRSRVPLWAVLGLLGGARGPEGQGAPLDRTLERWISATLRRGATLVPDPRASLEALATLMSRKGVSQLVLEDLDFADLPGAWTRRSAALAWGVFAVGSVVSVNVAAAMAGGRSALAGGIFGVAAVLAALIVQRGRPVKMTERLAWSWRRALAWTPISVGFSALMGLLFGLVVGTPAMSVALGAQFGLLIPAVIALEPSSLPSPVGANAGFRSSLRHALGIGLAAALAFGLFFAIAAVPLLEPLFGPPGGPVLPEDLSFKLAWEMSAVAGTVSLAVFGGRAAGRHLAIRLGLALSTPMPLRLVPWLDALVEDGLMRRVGGAYQFRHPTVLEHLAGRGACSAAGEASP